MHIYIYAHMCNFCSFTRVAATCHMASCLLLCFVAKEIVNANRYTFVDKRKSFAKRN